MENKGLEERTDHLLIRLDERLRSLLEEVKQNREENKKQFTELRLEVRQWESEFQKQIDEIHEKLETKYVSIESFNPIKTVIYGFVGLILTAAGTAILSLIFK